MLTIFSPGNKKPAGAGYVQKVFGKGRLLNKKPATGTYKFLVASGYYTAAQGKDMDNETDAAEKNDEAAYWDEFGIPVTATLRFTYQGSNDSITERIVDAIRFTEPDNGYSILGHCRTRNAERTFRIDRITKCTDDRTGYQVDDLYEYLFGLYQQTPNYSLDNVLADQIDTLRALAYVLEAGNRWQSQGQAVMGIACRKLSGDNRVTDAMLASHLESISGDSLQAYRMVVGRLNKSLSTEAKSAVLRLATKVANLDGHISAAEKEALDYMTTRFAKSE